MIAACYMLEKLKVDREVDVFQAVKQVRIPRPQLVTSLVSNIRTLSINEFSTQQTVGISGSLDIFLYPNFDCYCQCFV